jgi:hypothetical protein
MNNKNHPSKKSRTEITTVTVNGEQWTEVSDLLASGPDAQVYVTEIDEDGDTSIIFGDGCHGQRLPTGDLNISATYRYGAGETGEIAVTLQGATIPATRDLQQWVVIRNSPQSVEFGLYEGHYKSGGLPRRLYFPRSSLVCWFLLLILTLLGLLGLTIILLSR